MAMAGNGHSGHANGHASARDARPWFKCDISIRRRLVRASGCAWSLYVTIYDPTFPVALDPVTGEFATSVRDLAKHTDHSTRMVHYGIGELLKLRAWELLRIGGGREPNLYRVHPDVWHPRFGVQRVEKRADQLTNGFRRQTYAGSCIAGMQDPAPLIGTSKAHGREALQALKATIVPRAKMSKSHEESSAGSSPSGSPHRGPQAGPSGTGRKGAVGAALNGRGTHANGDAHGRSARLSGARQNEVDVLGRGGSDQERGLEICRLAAKYTDEMNRQRTQRGLAKWHELYVDDKLIDEAIALSLRHKDGWLRVQDTFKTYMERAQRAVDLKTKKDVANGGALFRKLIRQRFGAFPNSYRVSKKRMRASVE